MLPSRPQSSPNGRPTIPQRPKPSSGENPYEKNRSMLNPIDAASMASSGEVGDPRNMSVADFLQSQGIDMNGPAIQLAQWAKKQVDNSNNVNKINNIANDARQGAPGGASQAGPTAGRPAPRPQSRPSADLDQIAARY